MWWAVRAQNGEVGDGKASGVDDSSMARTYDGVERKRTRCWAYPRRPPDAQAKASAAMPSSAPSTSPLGKASGHCSEHVDDLAPEETLRKDDGYTQGVDVVL